MNQSYLILTDSGGLQEEACILGVPCVTLRDNTERPETVDVGANVLAGTDQNRIIASSKQILETDDCWNNPYGEGKSSESIIEQLDD